jgi:hypothetical protein
VSVCGGVHRSGNGGVAIPGGDEGRASDSTRLRAIPVKLEVKVGVSFFFSGLVLFQFAFGCNSIERWVH